MVSSLELKAPRPEGSGSDVGMGRTPESATGKRVNFLSRDEAEPSPSGSRLSRPSTASPKRESTELPALELPSRSNSARKHALVDNTPKATREAFKQARTTRPKAPAQNKKKAKDAAQQLWHEWAAENLSQMTATARKERLGPEVTKAIADEKVVARLIREAQKVKEMSDARLIQMQTFWTEVPEGKTVGVGKTTKERSKEQLLETARAVTRSALKKQLGQETLAAEITTLQVKEKEIAVVHQRAVSALERQVAALEERCRQAESHAVEQTEQQEQMRETIALLQQKILTAQEREIEHQRKLRVFTTLEPIFSRLAEQFSYNSPDEVVHRLEFLEQTAMNASDDLIKCQMENTALKKQVDHLHAELEATQSTFTNEEIRRQQQEEKTSTDHVEELQHLQDSLTKLREKESDMLNLQSAVADLWTRCCNNSELVMKTDQEQSYVLHEPLEMISALNELLQMHSPTSAGKSNRELQAFGMRVWRTHFQDRPGLKNKTLEIFVATNDMLSASLLGMEQSKADIAQLNKQLKQAKESEEAAHRQTKRTELYHEKFLDERRAQIGASRARPSSATPGTPRAAAAAAQGDRAPSTRPVSAAPAFGRHTRAHSAGARRARPVSATPFVQAQESKENAPVEDANVFAGGYTGVPIIEEEENPLGEMSGRTLGTAATKPRPYSAVPKMSTPNFVSLNDPSADGKTFKAKYKRPQTAVPKSRVR